MHSPPSHLESFCLELFGLTEADIDKLSTRYLADTLEITIRMKPDQDICCPDCKSQSLKIKSYVSKGITHSILIEKHVKLNFEHRRYACLNCRRTFYEKNPFSFKKTKLSVQTANNILQSLRHPSATFSSVAKLHHLSPTTVMHLFDDQIIYPPATTLPEVLLMDEVFAMKTETSSYVCVLLDFHTQQPVDILDNRREVTLRKYFSTFPRVERDKVKFVAGDMYTPYKTVTEKCFKNAVYCVDKFHIIQDADRKFTKVRTRIMKGYSTSSDEYYLLKKQNHLLNIKPDAFKYVEDEETGEITKEYVFDVNGPKTYNVHFKRSMNRYELKTELINIDYEIFEVYTFKNDLGKFYRENDLNSAPAALRKLIQDMKKAQAPEIQTIAGTLSNWFIEIVNSFTVMKTEYRISPHSGKPRIHKIYPTTSSLERLNKQIQDLKRNACGYTNFKRFRNRVLYVLRKDPPFPALKKQTAEDKVEDKEKDLETKPKRIQVNRKKNS